MSYLDKDTFKRMLTIEQTSIAKTLSWVGLSVTMFD